MSCGLRRIDEYKGKEAMIINGGIESVRGIQKSRLFLMEVKNGRGVLRDDRHSDGWPLWEELKAVSLRRRSPLSSVTQLQSALHPTTTRRSFFFFLFLFFCIDSGKH